MPEKELVPSVKPEVLHFCFRISSIPTYEKFMSAILLLNELTFMDVVIMQYRLCLLRNVEKNWSQWGYPRYSIFRFTIRSIPANEKFMSAILILNELTFMEVGLSLSCLV